MFFLYSGCVPLLYVLQISVPVFHLSSNHGYGNFTVKNHFLFLTVICHILSRKSYEFYEVLSNFSLC